MWKEVIASNVITSFHIPLLSTLGHGWAWPVTVPKYWENEKKSYRDEEPVTSDDQLVNNHKGLVIHYKVNMDW